MKNTPFLTQAYENMTPEQRKEISDMLKDEPKQEYCKHCGAEMKDGMCNAPLSVAD